MSHLIRFGLNELQMAYKAAREAPDGNRKRLEQKWTELQRDVTSGEATLTQETEDGQVIYDAGEHMGEMISETDAVVRIIRESFAIALHQFWERQMVRFMRAENYRQERAFEFLLQRGFTPEQGQLNILRLSANVAKHGAGDSAKSLYAIKPDIFDQEGMEFYQITKPSYEYLRISDEIIEGFFVAVQQSTRAPKG